MKEYFKKLDISLTHLEAFNIFFSSPKNYDLPFEKDDFEIYSSNRKDFIEAFSRIKAFDQLYNKEDRQMILADLFEYILLGRGFYAMGKGRRSSENKEYFVRGILHFVNLLMSYESITINIDRRNDFLDFLSKQIKDIEKEPGYSLLRRHKGSVGLPNPRTAKQKALNNYFDRLLPKTAGGLWHELLAYVFMLRNDLGYIIPLLLHQRLYSKNDHLVPPDFIIIGKDKRVYGIEVGIKKEIQSGSFSLKTAIPTATIDTINSRTSDRCPICKKWIQLCPFVIDRFSDFTSDLGKKEVRCLSECDIYSEEEIVNGKCKYCKYSRKKGTRSPSTQHLYSDGKHYHYSCVLDKVSPKKRREIIQASDSVALKTHIPYYVGLDPLFPNESKKRKKTRN